MEGLRKDTYRLVQMANYLVVFFAAIVTLSMGSQPVFFEGYLAAAVLYVFLLATPIEQGVKGLLRLCGALASITCIYISTPDCFAMSLFYLYSIRSALVMDKKFSLTLSSMVAVLFILANVWSHKLEWSTYNILWQLMNIALIVLITAFAQHLAYLERYERRQNSKIEQLLNQVEHSYQQMVVLADKDGLTGLYNYRSFRSKITDLNMENSAIILIDVDYFKEFNDRFGHLCGDAVLKELADIIAASIRGKDMLFRYGGEEFAIILENITEPELQSVALRISQNVANHAFYFDHMELGRVTVSIGYSPACEQTPNAEELFKVADAALYQAKNHGRNSVCCPEGQILVQA